MSVMLLGPMRISIVQLSWQKVKLTKATIGTSVTISILLIQDQILLSTPIECF